MFQAIYHKSLTFYVVVMPTFYRGAEFVDKKKTTETAL
jgi:hypothetical protein